jgi:hypothetical protein
MKKTLFAGIFVCLIGALYAQKVDLDRYSFSGTYWQLPGNPLPEAFKTYKVVVSSTGSSKSVISNQELIDKVNFGGWRKMEAAEKAHVTVNITVRPMTITGSEIAERKEESKDKDGKVTGVKYFYKVNYKYEMDVAMTAARYDEPTKQLYTGYTAGQSGVFSSAEFGSRSAAYDYKENNGASLRDQFLTEMINTACSKINVAFCNNYGLTEVTVTDHFWLMDSKKHPEQDSMQLMAKFMKTTMKAYTARVLSKEFKESVLPFTRYMQNLPLKYKTDEKADKKMRYAAYYNLAKLALYWENMAECEAFADMLIKNDYDPKDGEGFKKDTKKMKEIYTKAKIDSQHLSFDASTFEPPK